MAGMRCCDGRHLVIPRAHRLQGTASALLAGQKKEKTLWELDESLGRCSRNTHAMDRVTAVSPGWCPAVIQDVPAAGMSGWVGQPGKGWQGTAGAAPLAPPLSLSCEVFCWNTPKVELPWGGALGGSHVCTLLSALVRNFQAGLSVAMPAA